MARAEGRAFARQHHAEDSWIARNIREMVRQRAHHLERKRVAAGGAGQRQAGDGAVVGAGKMFLIRHLRLVFHRMSHVALLPLFAR